MFTQLWKKWWLKDKCIDVQTNLPYLPTCTKKKYMETSKENMHVDLPLSLLGLLLYKIIGFYLIVKTCLDYFIISLLQSVASTFFSSFYVVCGFHNFYWLHQGTAKINIAFMCRNRNIWSKWPYCTDILEEVSFYPHWRV